MGYIKPPALLSRLPEAAVVPFCTIKNYTQRGSYFGTLQLDFKWSLKVKWRFFCVSFLFGCLMRTVGFSGYCFKTSNPPIAMR